MIHLFLSAGWTPGLLNRPEEAEQIRQLEHERLRALVDADLALAQRLHAEDFQLNSCDHIVHRGPMYHTNVYERRG